MVGKSSNKIHQTWGPPFSQAQYGLHNLRNSREAHYCYELITLQCMFTTVFHIQFYACHLSFTFTGGSLGFYFLWLRVPGTATKIESNHIRRSLVKLSQGKGDPKGVKLTRERLQRGRRNCRKGGKGWDPMQCMDTEGETA